MYGMWKPEELRLAARQEVIEPKKENRLEAGIILRSNVLGRSNCDAPMPISIQAISPTYYFPSSFKSRAARWGLNEVHIFIRTVKASLRGVLLAAYSRLSLACVGLP